MNPKYISNEHQMFSELDAIHDAEAQFEAAVEAEFEEVLSNPSLLCDYIFDGIDMSKTVTVDDGTEMSPQYALIKYAPGWLREQLFDRLQPCIEGTVERRLRGR